MIRLYHKELKKLKGGQNVALVTVLENGKREIEYYQFINGGTNKDKGKNLYAFKHLQTNEVWDQWNIKAFGKRYQKRWPIVYQQFNGDYVYVAYKYFGKLSQKDEMILVGELLIK